MSRAHTWRMARYFILAGLVAVCLVRACLKKTKQQRTPTPMELYEIISPSTYKYVLNQPAACRRDDRRPFLVLMVPVAPGDLDSREAVRKTWGRGGLVSDVEVLTLFFLGVVSGKGVQESLEEESRGHGDIIQMDFLDSYKNLTIKTMMMMNWLSSHCQHASYAMKIDADVFLNVHQLLGRLPRPAKQNYITGSVIRDGRPRRDKSSKWYLSEEVYPQSTLPPYVSGAGYVFSADLAQKISWASRFVRPLPLEDVYVGLCLEVLGVSPVYSTSRFFTRNLFEVRHLNYDRCTFFSLIIANGFTPSEMLHVWADFQKAPFTC
ncbi:beta-1,3-galactosyltransferase 2 [Denticeps clupeoides]|uniref:beta-1,3-galactosyltransferase 2 n=1 Tax=Denticeps clupeoides TaxID=299321 RepID=UPI0010A438DF|nr:beta-1,3-galactosyltransferase 2-like [Denticeps clupeoides]